MTILTLREKASLKKIDELKDDIVVYTDGSAKAGYEKGGSAAVITLSRNMHPVGSGPLKHSRQ